jgi:hypothetical protein
LGAMFALAAVLVLVGFPSSDILSISSFRGIGSSPSAAIVTTGLTPMDDDDDVENPRDDDVDSRPTALPNSSSLQQRGFLFIKTPKVGGTTLAVTLQRTALYFNMSVAVPTPRMDRETCGHAHEDAVKVWTRMLRKNPAGLQVFASQVCMHPFMLRNGWRDNKPPILLGLVRDPWSRWVSAWRYLEKRCEENDQVMPHDIQVLCTTRLSRGFERYTQDICEEISGSNPQCSVQHAWLAPEHYTAPAVLLKTYDLILVIEEFDLSLAVLHFDYGVPLSALPYIVANQDKSVPVPHISADVKAKALARGLSIDAALYRLAKQRLMQRADDLNRTTAGKFHDVVATLKRANAKAQVECTTPDSLHENDCIVTSRLVKKTEGCRHRCLDGIWQQVLINP